MLIVTIEHPNTGIIFIGASTCNVLYIYFVFQVQVLEVLSLVLIMFHLNEMPTRHVSKHCSSRLKDRIQTLCESLAKQNIYIVHYMLMLQ